MMPMSTRDVALTLAVIVIWGVNFMAIKWGVAEVPPLLLTALRYVVAAVPAIFFVRRPTVRLSILVAYGLAIGVGQFGLLFSAIHLGMPAGLASLVLQLQSFFTIGLAVAFLGERPKGAQLFGALVALVGIGGIIAVREAFEGAALWPFGDDGLRGGGMLEGVASTSLVKKAGRIDMLGFVVWSSLAPPIPLYLLSLIFEGPGAVPLGAQRRSAYGSAPARCCLSAGSRRISATGRGAFCSGATRPRSSRRSRCWCRSSASPPAG